ncbi:limb region 1 protein homolog isoform X2 [Zophobas morio]|uniref:limb region 1 protein homolog isoform X2 n=1 Tax=Zophobas morio TaxID=2755281 RepID=UPI0030830C89
MTLYKEEIDVCERDKDLLDDYYFKRKVQYMMVYLVLFGGLYSLVYLAIGKLLRKEGDIDEIPVSYAERILNWVSCGSVSLSSASVLLLPLIIFSHELLRRSSVQCRCVFYPWLDSALFVGCWAFVFRGGNLFLLVLMPITFFFHELEVIKTRPYEPSFFKQWRLLFYKMLKALFTVVIFWTMLGLLTFLLNSLSGLAYREPLKNSLSFLPSLLGLFCAWIFLVFVPRGILKIVTASLSSLGHPLLLTGVSERMDKIFLERSSLLRKVSNFCIAADKMKFESLNGAGLKAYAEQLECLTCELLRLQDEIQSSTYLRAIKLLFQGLIFALSLLCTVALVVRLFKKLLAVVLGTEGTAIFILQETFFGRKEAFFLGGFEAFFEVLLLLYFYVSVFFGLYTFKSRSNGLPRKRLPAFPNRIFGKLSYPSRLTPNKLLIVRLGKASRPQVFLNAAIISMLSLSFPFISVSAGWRQESLALTPWATLIVFHGSGAASL